MPVSRAFVYVLRIPTVLIMITASSLGYFFCAGVRTFGVLFATQQYGIPRSAASAMAIVIGAGGIIGLYLGGHGAARLLGADNLNGRILVPLVWLLVSPLILAPALLATSPLTAVPLLFLGGITVTAATHRWMTPASMWSHSACGERLNQPAPRCARWEN
ncbi:hypothetical protein ACFW4M_28535 [Streptomyces sp. NPDC058794]|uniref:hypothetical protein n=1 Tax=Streptomyces sp. NPDC058794 TaxID=3346636 RepID=UPI00368947DF